MIGANDHATFKAGLEAHTKYLAAELVGTGVNGNAYRPGAVDTAMQAWIRSQPAEDVGAALHEQFQSSYDRESPTSPEHSAQSYLNSDERGKRTDLVHRERLMGLALRPSTEERTQ